ncbi:hypothetical protein [Haloechinothrix sp. LS1_15]|uniref:hypothetical protein n=1 Tax=Haloechinothrix sp. LS1_15 TaxID=2652248 RepID=UPI00294652AA|nr:hypothetical protein [Haloechinothrix sp. LS1_15]MDV6014331.1 hypothetical protein [Haloechinothrix sp. LS1_15]
MSRLTVIVGGILTVTGIIAYAATGAASVTALIPSFIGVLLIVCGVLARKPTLHRYSLAAAMVIALLGALGALRNVADLGELFAGTADTPSAVITSTIMFVLLVVYLVVGVVQFLRARRSPSSGERV